MGKMTIRYLDETGDSCREFDTADTVQLEAAEKLFNEKFPGKWAFKVNPDKSSEVLKQFDPTAQEIVISRQLYGG